MHSIKIIVMMVSLLKQNNLFCIDHDPPYNLVNDTDDSFINASHLRCFGYTFMF